MPFGRLGRRAGELGNYMENILTKGCHAVRPPKEAVASGVSVKVTHALEHLSEWERETPGDPRMAGMRGMANALANRIKPALDGNNAHHDLQELSKQADDLLKVINKNRPLTVRANGKTYHLDGQFLADWAHMSPQMRAAALRQLEQKLENGKRLHDMIERQGGNGADEAPTLERMSDLIHYLSAEAQRKAGHSWARGAFVMDDAGSKVHEWFDRAHGIVYTRDSSHLSSKDQHAERGQGRGFDFNKHDLRESLPYGQRTLLLQRLVRENRELLYVKQESEGAVVNLGYTRGPFGKLLHQQKNAPDSRDIQYLSDTPEAVRHLINLIKGDKDTSGLARHGEKWDDQPQGVRDAYQEVYDAAQQVSEDAGNTAGLGVKADGSKIEKAEVSQQYANVTDLEGHVVPYDPNNPPANPNAQQKLAKAIYDWKAAAQNAWGPNYQTDVNQRVGNEVILHRGDL